MDASSATSTEKYEVTAFSMKAEELLLDASGLRGTRSHASERVRQSTRAPGFTLTMQPNSVELDSLLPRILGTAEAADVFAVADSLTSMTFVTVADVGQDRWQFTGCQVNRATFTGSQGQLLDLTLEVEALEITKSATAFASLSVSTVGPYVFSDLVLSVSGTNYSFKDFKLTIDNHLLVDRFFNSQTRASLPASDRTVTWEVNGPHGDDTGLYNLSSAGVRCIATFTNGNRSIQFDSIAVAFPKMPPTVNGRDEILLPLSGVARTSGSTKELVTTNDSTG